MLDAIYYDFEQLLKQEGKTVHPEIFNVLLLSAKQPKYIFIVIALYGIVNMHFTII